MASQGSSDRAGERAVSPTEKSHAKSSTLTVERLTHAEIPEICSLFKRVWDAFEPGLSADLAKSWKPTPLEFTSWMERVTYFAAMRDGRIIGTVGCETSDGNCRLIHLVVDREADGRVWPRRSCEPPSIGRGTVTHMKYGSMCWPGLPPPRRS